VIDPPGTAPRDPRRASDARQRAYAAASFSALTALVAFAGCRERAIDSGHDEDRAGHATAHAAAPAAGTSAAPPRILYPSAGAPVSFVDLVTGARQGVVAIRAGAPIRSGPAAIFPGTPETTADVALGTGFLIEARGVFVLTNDHIAAAAPELKVVLADRREVAAKLVGRDVRLDLALLSIDVPRLTPLPLGNSDELQVGEWLVVLGNAFGDEVTASAGVVSATGRDIAGTLDPGRSDAASLHQGPGRAMSFRTFLQTDARIQRGNSGGPVLDTAGQVIGVAVATGDRPGEVSFAIPINRVKEIVDALRDFGQVTRSWLGVLVQPVDPERAQTVGLTKPTGALVTEVKTASPAARGGLRVGDIILAWGDREVDHRSLPWIVAQAPANRPISVTLWRDRAQQQVAIVPEKMPE
jgi:serine protease Do